MTGSILTGEQWPILDPNYWRQVYIGRKAYACPWRKVPKEFGNWRALHKLFTAWVNTGKVRVVFEYLSSDCDLEDVSIDSTIVSAHQHSSGARCGEETAIGKSVGGNTSKIHAVADSFGRPVDFIITEGQWPV